jgi:formate-dependent nitrite reductase membrane component NrfD
MLSNLVICYLFLGGAAAAALLAIIVLDLLTPRKAYPNDVLAADGYSLEAGGKSYFVAQDQKILLMRACQMVSGVLILSALCLAVDLGKPDRLLHLFTHPTLSYITIGTWALTLSILCSMALAILWSVSQLRLPYWLVRVIEWLGLMAAAATILYTALLLWSIGTGILLGFWLLPVLFVLSSLSTGLALLFLVGSLTDAGRNFVSLMARLARLDAAVILVELVALTALLLFGRTEVAYSPSIDALVAGEFAGLFWIGVVCCGLIAPLLLDGVMGFFANTGSLVSVARHTSTVSYVSSGANSMRVISTMNYLPAALMVLVGGFCLRFCLVSVSLSPILSASPLIGA